MSFLLKDKLTFLLKGLAFFVWFAFFVVIVKPEVGRHVIPWLIDFTEARAESQRGIDLDPIVLPSTGESELPRSSLYSTRAQYGGGIYGELVTSDTRVVAMNRFLADYGSPMAPYAEIIVQEADRNRIDWRLLTGISGVESAFGKLIRRNSHNAWGWMGGPRGSISYFSSWGESIVYVSAGLGRGYRNLTPHQMESRYCPPCGATGMHYWANGVTRFMNQLDNYRSNL